MGNPVLEVSLNIPYNYVLMLLLYRPGMKILFISFIVMC